MAFALPNYTFLDLLGEGNFAKVYRARRVGAAGFHKDVAIKVIDEMDGEAVRRLRDEARMLAFVQHRAIIQVEDLIELGGGWGLVMELVRGVGLDRVSGKVWPEGAALEVVGEIAGALHVAFHTLGTNGRPLRLLHRDIKPANIMLTHHGDVKLLDFGVAFVSMDSRESVTLDGVYGSMGYMAPERWGRKSHQTSDVYSLGVVLWELLTGRRFGRAVNDRVPFVERLNRAMTELPDTTSESVRDLLMDMLTFDPEARPSAGEVEERALALARRAEVNLRGWCRDMVPPPAPPVEEGARIRSEGHATPARMDDTPRALGALSVDERHLGGRSSSDVGLPQFRDPSVESAPAVPKTVSPPSMIFPWAVGVTVLWMGILLVPLLGLEVDPSWYTSFLVSEHTANLETGDSERAGEVPHTRETSWVRADAQEQRLDGREVGALERSEELPVGSSTMATQRVLARHAWPEPFTSRAAGVEETSLATPVHEAHDPPPAPPERSPLEDRGGVSGMGPQAPLAEPEAPSGKRPARVLPQGESSGKAVAAATESVAGDRPTRSDPTGAPALHEERRGIVQLGGTSKPVVLLDQHGDRWDVPGAVPEGDYRVILNQDDTGGIAVRADSVVRLSCGEGWCVSSDLASR